MTNLSKHAQDRTLLHLNNSKELLEKMLAKVNDQITKVADGRQGYPANFADVGSAAELASRLRSAEEFCR